MARKSKFFRVAVEGATTDGREISRDWIEQMAASYKPATYGARVNCEHIRGFAPDKPFNAYGDVLAVEARDVELEIDGKNQKRLALYAQIEPTDDLVKITDAKQKIYTSIEVNPNFAGTGKAYLMGLAVTDSPASLGTDILQFAAGHPDASPFAGRKQAAGNLFTAAELASIELEPETTSAAATNIVDAVVAAFAKLAGKQPEPEKVVTPPAGGDVAAQFAAFGAEVKAAMTAVATTIQEGRTADQAAFTQLRADFDGLRTKLSDTEQPGKQRPAASGAPDYELTDC